MIEYGQEEPLLRTGDDGSARRWCGIMMRISGEISFRSSARRRCRRRLTHE